METIKGAVDTASKVLFGDQTAKTGEQEQHPGLHGHHQHGEHSEPRSGVTGNTSRGEPYDGGNLDQSPSGKFAGPGYTEEDDRHAFRTSHEIPRDTNTGTSGLTGGSTNAGPHDTNVGNKLDPRVDSDRDGRSGPTGSSHTTGTGLTGSHGGSTNAGPHDTNTANKLDPRVDSDRDGRSGTGQHNTQSGGVGETLSKAAATVTGGAVGGAAAHEHRGAEYDNRGTSGNNNNLNEYSMKDATQHAAQGQHEQPHISHSSVGGGQRHQGANDPTDVPSHHESSAIRDTKHAAERKLDPSHDSSPHGPGASSGGVGQDPHSVRQGSLTGHIPGAPGGEGLQRTTGEGTGKEYVKSTGLAAEGGDFDASRPGAGKEADRLLEERGVPHGESKHVGHGHEEASSKMAGGHATTGTHSHGAHTGTPGTLGTHDRHDRNPTPSSTTGIHHGISGSTTTHTSTTGAHSGTHTGAHDTTGTHTGTHGEGPLHADLKGVRHDKGHGNDGVYGSVAEGTTDEKPSLKDKIKAKIHMS